MVKILECDNDLHKALKLSAVSKDMALKNLLKEIIQDYLKSEKESSGTPS